MKLHNVFIILTLSFLLISAAYASEDSTQDDVNTIEKTEKISNLDDVITYNQDTPSVEKDSSPNKAKDLTTHQDQYPQKPVEIQYEDGINKTGDCSTVIIQISEYESVLSFRRDTTGSTVNIYVSNNSSFIKQYKTSGSYFFHVLVSKDGWMVGTGGADNARINSLIETRHLT